MQETQDQNHEEDSAQEDSQECCHWAFAFRVSGKAHCRNKLKQTCRNRQHLVDSYSGSESSLSQRFTVADSVSRKPGRLLGRLEKKANRRGI